MKRGGLIFTGGQADLDEKGRVINPHDLTRQTTNVIQHIEAILEDLNASLGDVIKLLVYFSGDASDESHILDLIASHLNPDTRPVISTVCLPELCYPGMRIELEAIAIDPASRSDDNPSGKRHPELAALHPQFSHAIRCNDLIFTSDLSSLNNHGAVQAANELTQQTHLIMDQLQSALSLFGATQNEVLKLNVYYVGDGTSQSWEEPAAIRAKFFTSPGPAATGIAVDRFATDGLMTKIAVTASAPKRELQTPTDDVQYSWPEGHWNWTKPLPYWHGNRFGEIIHLGGQVALDTNATVLQPDNIVAQTKIALKNTETVLADLGACMDDIVKVTAFYRGSASAEELHQNLVIRSSAFTKPGPATSGIPVPHLVYEFMMIEIEVIAVVSG